MENQDLKSSSQNQEKEIDLFELLQKFWTLFIKWSSRLVYRFIRFIIFSIRNIHWLILSGILGLLIGYSQFKHTGKIYEASSVLYLPHENVLICIQELENINLLLQNQDFEKIAASTSVVPETISNLLSIEYAYGVLVEGNYPNYFVPNFEYNNKKQERLSTNYLEITIKSKKLFSEDTVQMILKDLLAKNEYLSMVTKNYLDQQKEYLSLLDSEIIKAQQAAEVELTKRQHQPTINNIVLSSGIDTTTLVRPFKLQREKLDIEYQLKLFQNGFFVFVNDFYFTKVLNSTSKYAIRWTLVFMLIMYGILFYIKRKKYIKLFFQKIQGKNI